MLTTKRLPTAKSLAFTKFLVIDKFLIDENLLNNRDENQPLLGGNTFQSQMKSKMVSEEMKKWLEEMAWFISSMVLDWHY